MLTDWRGNEYEGGEPLGRPCDWPGCDAEAVRHRCNAEGDVGRSHWHGGIHRLDGEPGDWYCNEHGKRVLMANAHIKARAGGVR